MRPGRNALEGATNGEQSNEAKARSRFALKATWVLLLGGVVGACVTGGIVYHSANARGQTSFTNEATSMSSALGTALRRDEDFVISQEGMFEAFPGLTNRQYSVAIEPANVAARYPGSFGFDYIERVPAAHFPAFARTQAADPLQGVPTPASSSFAPFPPGQRSQYCITRVGVQAVPISFETQIATFDFCAPLPGVGFPAAIAAATSTGSLAVAPPISFYPGMFFVFAPVYRAGVVPTTVAARRSAVEGWALATFSGNGTLSTALGQVRGFGLRLSYGTSASRAVAVASVGVPRGGSTYSTSLQAGQGGRWYITVVGNAASGGANEAVLVGLLVLGIAVLLFAMVRLLAGSRQRALLLVDERTSEVRHQALHDSLTGLPNRALVLDRAAQMLARGEREDIDVGVLFIDLDNFKEINDSFGHQQGDLLLKAVGERLASAVRPGDSVGRLGGDEFVVLVQGNSIDAGPALVAERVLEVLAQPFLLNGMQDTPLNVRASIGVAIGPSPSAGELLRDADVALYQAKQAGKGRYVMFQPAMQLAVQDRLALEMDLRVAIAEGQVFVEYQPIFDLGTLAITGVEALARWHHPTRGLIGPDRFIPVAEASGLINALGSFVLNEGCRQATAWAAMGRAVPLSVNISGRQLESDNFVAEVRAALDASELDPTLLTLELTETVLMHDVDATVPRLEALKDLGVRLAIDDFGTGYSSLAYLRRFPVDVLKIDRSFIAGMARSREAHALIHTFVQLGKTLGISTVAEGIEDEAQLNEMQREQCDHGQGFYYSRPLPASALDALLILRDPLAARSLGIGG